MKRFQAVEVYWVDSHMVTDWTGAVSGEKTAKEMSLLCRTVGILIKKNKKRIIITQSISILKSGYVDNMMETIIIPMCAVKKINKL